MRRFSELDAIRGIAALMVVLYHYTVRYGEIYGYSTPPLFTFEIGAYGVQLFFIVSGFVIFLTLDRTDRAVDFVVSRFSRLYPAYWASIILTFVVVSIFSLPGREVSAVDALVNLTMLQNWFYVPNVDGVYWTLVVELSFYFIMWCLFVSNLLKRIEIISLAWLFLINAAHYFEMNSNIEIHVFIKLLLLLEYGHLFIAGVFFYRFMKNNKKINYFIVFLCLGTEYFLNGNIALLVFAYFLLFYLFTLDKLKFLAMKPLVFLGSISYSLYLIHQNIGYVILLQLDKFGFMNPFTIIVLPLIVSMLIAILIQKYIEKPFLMYIRTKWKNSSLRVFIAK